MNNKPLKIIVVGSFKWEQYAPAFYSGFETLGHKVIKIDYEEYFLKQSNFFSILLNKIQSRFHLGFGVYRFNRDIRKKTIKFGADFIFFYRCYAVKNATIDFVKKCGAKVYSYNNDDPFSGVPSKEYYRNFIRNSRLSDINYVYRKKNIDDFKALGLSNTKLLLPYYITTKNYYKGLKKDIGIAFVGHYENDGRDVFIKAMVDAGLPISVYGDEAWKTSPLYPFIEKYIFPAQRGEAYNYLLNRIEVSLVFLSKINKDTYTRRCFEIPTTKSVMLCEYTEDMNKFFPEDKCAVYFRSVEELLGKAMFLLKNKEKVISLREAAYQRIKELGASEVDRAREIVECYKKY